MRTQALEETTGKTDEEKGTYMHHKFTDGREHTNFNTQRCKFRRAFWDLWGESRWEWENHNIMRETHFKYLLQLNSVKVLTLTPMFGTFHRWTCLLAVERLFMWEAVSKSRSHLERGQNVQLSETCLLKANIAFHNFQPNQSKQFHFSYSNRESVLHALIVALTNGTCWQAEAMIINLHTVPAQHSLLTLNLRADAVSVSNTTRWISEGLL